MIAGVMASGGIPGMVGFIAEFVVYRSSYPIFPVQTLLCVLGTGLTAVYFLNLVNRAFFGRLPESLENLPRVYWRDRLPSVLMTVLIIFLGLQPSWLFRWSEVTSASLGALTTNPIANRLAPPLIETVAIHPPEIEPIFAPPFEKFYHSALFLK
jgi:NAD(P)H-quinone oxidoreductase subunit 4